jgi:hypothetical protein
MNEEIPTMEQLMDKVGAIHLSCGYGENRTVLNHTSRVGSILKYGLGLGGFVAVWKDSRGFPHANSYFVKNPFGGYPNGGFRELRVDKALEIIDNNKLIAEKWVDEKELKMSMEKKRFTRPEVGELVFDYGNHLYVFRVSKYKNGKYCVEKWYTDSNGKDRWKNSTDIRDLLSTLSLAQGKSKKEHSWETIPKMKSNTIPKKDLERMQMFVMTQEV